MKSNSRIDIKSLLLIAAGLLASAGAQACPGQLPPEQRLQQALDAQKDLALVEVDSDIRRVQPVSAFAILKVTQGWGSPKKRHLTYFREATACGEPERLDKGGRYLVVLDRHKVVDVFEYSKVKKALKSLGDPHYKYNRQGVFEKSGQAPR